MSLVDIVELTILTRRADRSLSLTARGMLARDHCGVVLQRTPSRPDHPVCHRQRFVL
jgi:hypothetical protein